MHRFSMIFMSMMLVVIGLVLTMPTSALAKGAKKHHHSYHRQHKK